MITRILIVLNLIGFLLEFRVAGPGLLTGAESEGMNRLLFEAALIPVAVTQGGQWWRIITGGFMHGSLLHIGVNMMSLWFIGRFIEYALGSWRMFVVYMVSLVASGLGVV